MRLLLLTILLSFFAFAQAQEVPHTSPPTDNGQMYQLYLDQPVQKIIKVEYLDGTPIKHDLGKDGETLYLLDYHKRGRVKVVTEDVNGEQKEVFRSPCYIDPVIPT